MSTVRELADAFHQSWLATHPFAASTLGIPGYDDRVPDDSEEGDAGWRAELEAVLADARRLEDQGATGPAAVTLGCLVESVEQEIRALDARPAEHTVTAMPFSGPAVLLATAARTVLPDPEAAAAYLERLRRSGRWIDQQAGRLRVGAAKGRLPVAPLVRQAVSWVEDVLRPPVPESLTSPRPPEGWDGAAKWLEERDRAAAEVVKPALGRWLEALAELLPRSRPAEAPGLVHLPGGEADYAGWVRSSTTLAVTPEEIHRIGRAEIEVLEARAVALGSEIGLSSLEAVHGALRASAGTRSPVEAIEAATAAIRRAEARAGEYFPQPLPAPCAVTPMPSVVGASGMAPHYTPPRLDGGRPGTFWFNLDRPTAGTGWDLEGVAFHEGVPGHHLQLSRIQMLEDLPALQRQRSLPVFSEGWGLYAEQLAEETGLYSDTRSLLGANAAALMRAGRLVVDTGLHALGWSRDEAVSFFVAHVPLPEPFLANEIDRYIVMPGQALSYLMGKRELLRLRQESARARGTRFALPEFHAVVLDSGSLPLPVLEAKVRAWAHA